MVKVVYHGCLPESSMSPGSKSVFDLFSVGARGVPIRRGRDTAFRDPRRARPNLPEIRRG